MSTPDYTPSAERYEKIPYRRVGKSGLQLPAISLGCWHNFGGAGTDSGGHENEAEFHDNCRAMLFAAFDHGITHFDLANNYGPPPGAAEARVGQILQDDFSAHRDELIISSKAGFLMWPGPYGDWGSRKYLLSSLDQSLQRLGLEYVDIFYHHRPDPNTPLEETLGALDDAVRSGKALYCGLSNYSGALFAEAMRVCEQNSFVKPVIHQPSYSLLNRGIEQTLLPVTKQLGVGVIAFCPLQQGLLTDKYLSGVPDDSRAASEHGFLKREMVTTETVSRVQALNAIAEERGQTLAQMALSWVLRNDNVTSALIGASRPSQIVENVAAAQKLEFSDDELQKIEDALQV
jgi:L-glyceraldehyde 3-phosphate reductase